MAERLAPGAWTAMTPEQQHEFQHDQIAERRAAYKSAPRRSAVDKARRREMGKRWYGALNAHLRQFHKPRRSGYSNGVSLDTFHEQQHHA